MNENEGRKEDMDKQIIAYAGIPSNPLGLVSTVSVVWNKQTLWISREKALKQEVRKVPSPPPLLLHTCTCTWNKIIANHVGFDGREGVLFSWAPFYLGP